MELCLISDWKVLCGGKYLSFSGVGIVVCSTGFTIYESCAFSAVIVFHYQKLSSAANRNTVISSFQLKFSISGKNGNE